MTGAGEPRVRRRPVGTWRLEWLRMVRTPRAITLAAVYVAFGLLGPVLSKYLPEIVKHVQSGMTITVATPTPKDGIVNYVGQVSQTGLVVVVVIAAGALAFDSHRGLSTFLRTRAASLWDLVLPRFAVTAGAAVAAYLAGTLAAWYGTSLLLGGLTPDGVLAGVLCESVYLVFAVAVVAAAASVVRTTLATVGAALGVLLLLPIAGLVGVLHDWLPSTLVNAPVELLGTAGLSDYLPALVVSAVASVLLLVLAVTRLRRREV